MVLRGWAKLRGADVMVERHPYIDGPERKAYASRKLKPSPDFLDWGSEDEKEARGAHEPRRPIRQGIRNPEPFGLAGLTTAAAAAAREPTESDEIVLKRRLAALAPAERDRLLTDLIREHAAAVLGHESVGAVLPDRAFHELGLDSLAAVEMRDRLNTATGLRLPVTVLFDYASAAALARHLRDELLGPDTPAAGEPAEDNEILVKRIGSGDLISDTDLREALRTLQAQSESWSAAQAAWRIGHAQDDGPEDDLGPLSAEETELVARAAASTINHTLARLFLRLGPPPEGAMGDFVPVTNGGGGAQQ